MRSQGEQQAQSRRSSRPEAAGDPGVPIPSDALGDPVVTETIPVTACVVRLAPGLFAVEIVNGAANASDGGRPLAWLGEFAPEGNGIEVLSARGSGAQWLPAGTTSLAIRAPEAGRLLMATAFGSARAPAVTIRSFDVAAITAAPAPAAGAQARAAAPPLSEREIRTEVTAHIERIGDRVFAGSAWAGTPGEQKRIEGFSIRPLQEIQPTEIEYKALHPGGVETPWVRGPQYCGTRGRALPLTGFAVRIAPHVQDQFSVIYQAAFFRSGITEPRSNGAPCLPNIPGDTIEGINIRIVQRRPG